MNRNIENGQSLNAARKLPSSLGRKLFIPLILTGVPRWKYFPRQTFSPFFRSPIVWDWRSNVEPPEEFRAAWGLLTVPFPPYQSHPEEGEKTMRLVELKQRERKEKKSRRETDLVENLPGFFVGEWEKEWEIAEYTPGLAREEKQLTVKRKSPGNELLAIKLLQWDLTCAEGKEGLSNWNADRLFHYSVFF